MPADGPLELDDRIVWFKNGNIHREDGPAGFLPGDQELSGRRAPGAEKRPSVRGFGLRPRFQLDQILVREQEKERERDIHFVDLGRYLCERCASAKIGGWRTWRRLTSSWPSASRNRVIVN